MSAVDLLQPILDGGVRRNNFFNGRLLSAEDLRAEQDATRARDGQLAEAIGDGVAWGLEVSVAGTSSGAATVLVREGLAINRHRDVLSLAEDTEVALVPTRPAVAMEAAGLFGECEPPRASVAYTGAGAYVLVAAPASGYAGTALVSDPNTTAVGRGTCGARFNVEGVRFRLVPVGLTRLGIEAGLLARVTALLPPSGAASRERLRNLLAHLCFGTQALRDYFSAPSATGASAAPWTGWGLLDAMRDVGDLTDCDVPLALVAMNGTGISFVDVWPVRRRILDAAAIDVWRPVAGPRRAAEGEAAFLQFQAQLAIVRGLGAPGSVAAATYFDVLPAAGWLPTGPTGFAWNHFLGVHAPANTTPVDAALVRGVIQRSWHDEPFVLGATPPAVLRVYEVPGQPFVAFARSDRGTIRVTLTPNPGGPQTVEVAATARNGVVTRSVQTAGQHPISELAPGWHTVSVTAPDYVAVAPVQLNVVGGQAVNLAFTLVPLPNGSILVDALDRSTDVSLAPGTVGSITATGGTTTRTATLQNGKWLLANLPAGTYTITGTATGYSAPAAITVGPTAPGTQLTAVLRFDPVVHTAAQPPACVAVAKVVVPNLTNVRFCLLLKATEFEQAYYYYGGPATGSGRGAATEEFRIARRTRAAANRGTRHVTASGEIVYTAEPWAAMTELNAPQATKTAVQGWLAPWRDWLAGELHDEAIRTLPVRVMLDPSYRLPTSTIAPPARPPGYAVFGHFGVPIEIRADAAVTKLPVPIERALLPWVSLETFEALDAAEIDEVNELAYAWTELVVDATGDPSSAATQLIADAVLTIPKINAVRGYYPGVTPQIDTTLKSHGFPTDLTLANADVGKLTKVLANNRGFAVRLIYEARQIVPASSWGLGALPLTDQQKEKLIALGIDSQGSFLVHAGTTAGKETIATALNLAGLPASKKQEVINPLVNETERVFTRNAVALAPTVTVSVWPGVDPTTAANLEAAGFTTVDQVAHADPAAVATATNTTLAAAQTLVTTAVDASISAAHLETIVSLSGSESTKLTTALGTTAPTLANIVAKSPSELSGAFGSEERASAVIGGIMLGFGDRGMM